MVPAVAKSWFVVGRWPSPVRRGLVVGRWLAIAAAYAFLLRRWFDDPAAALGQPRATSVVVPLLLLFALALWSAFAYRSTLAAMSAELVAAVHLTRGEGVLLALVIGASLAFQLPTMLYPAALLHSDAAINGLMGLHIAEGRVAPAFYYGQEFMGTLFSHLLGLLFVAVGPFVGGTSVLTWLFYAGFLIATFYLVRQASAASVAFAVATWLALPPSILVLILAQTEYAQFLLLCSAAVLVAAARLGGRLRQPGWWWVAGVLLGLAFWAHAMSAMVIAAVGLSVVVLLPAKGVVAAAWRLLVGFVVGLGPGLVGWGWRLGNFFEWFLEGGGRGGDATLVEAVAGIARLSLGVLLLGTEAHEPMPVAVAAALLVLVVGSAAGLIVVVVRGRLRGAPLGLGIERAAAALPLAAFVLLQLVVLATRRYADVPVHYTVPLYLGLPAVVAVAAWWALSGRARYLSATVAVAVLLWGAISLPKSIAWLRTLPANQASMDASIQALQAAGVETCRGPYWDAYRLSYLTLEEIVCESIDVRRVPGYPERIEQRRAGPPAFVAAPQRRQALEQYMRRLEQRDMTWTYLRTPRFEVLLPRRR